MNTIPEMRFSEGRGRFSFASDKVYSHTGVSVSLTKGLNMLWYAWVFLVIAILAAVLGFGGIASAAAGIAKIFFVVFLVLFLLSLFVGRRGAV